MPLLMLPSPTEAVVTLNRHQPRSQERLPPRKSHSPKEAATTPAKRKRSVKRSVKKSAVEIPEEMKRSQRTVMRTRMTTKLSLMPDQTRG